MKIVWCFRSKNQD